MKLPSLGKYSFSFIVMALTMFFMPVHYRFLPPGVIILGILWLMENVPEFRFHAFAHQKIILVLFLLFFLWQAMTLLYSEDKATGWHNIAARLSLFAYPVILFDPEKSISVKRSLLLRIFALSAALYMVICFGIALERSVYMIDGKMVFNPVTPEAKWLNYFYGSDLAVTINPTYMSMFVLTGAFIAFESMRDRVLKKSVRFAWLLCGLFLLLSIWFLSSRAGMFAAILMLIVYAASLIIAGKQRIILAGFIVLLIAVGVPLISQNARFAFFLERLSEKNFKPTDQDKRFIIWRYASELIKENPVAGYGIGDARNELTERFRRAGETELYTQRYHVHNQFLESILEGGVVQLLLLCALVSTMAGVALRQKNILYGLFVLMMIVFFMIESVLSRFAGAAFFSLFGMLLINTGKVRE